MVAPMKSNSIRYLLTALLLAVLPIATEQPDFEQLTDLINRTLVSTGQGVHPGDRSEIYRVAPDGWEIQMMTIWAGDDWKLLALRLHHPDQAPSETGEWHERYAHLLQSMDRGQVADFIVPELVEVPPPSFIPALPGELRSRRFAYQGYWYKARWINDGGLDDRAHWTLRSYELVALQ